MSLCQDVLIHCPSKLPTKDTFAQKKVPRPVSRDGSDADRADRGESPEGPRTPASFADCGGVSPGVASPAPATRSLPKNERKRLGARTPGGASSASVQQPGACTPGSVVADPPTRAPKASDLAKREPPRDAEPMNDHDYDGLLAVRLALMGKAAPPPPAEEMAALAAGLGQKAPPPPPPPDAPGSGSVSTLTRTAVTAPTADLGTVSRDGSDRCASPDMRAQLLGSIRSELIRGLAAPRQASTASEDVRSEHSTHKM